MTYWKDKLWQQNEVEENENLKLHVHLFLESCSYASMYIFDRLIGVGPGIVS